VQNIENYPDVILISFQPCIHVIEPAPIPFKPYREWQEAKEELENNVPGK
jgi:hypothetical protein